MIGHMRLSLKIPHVQRDTATESGADSTDTDGDMAHHSTSCLGTVAGCWRSQL